MRQILVQVAIKLTNPDELDNLVAELVPLEPTIGERTAKAELAPPLLRPKLNLLKKSRRRSEAGRTRGSPNFRSSIGRAFHMLPRDSTLRDKASHAFRTSGMQSGSA